VGIVGAVLQKAVEETATDSESYSTVRAKETVSAEMGRRVEVEGHATYLFAPVTMIMGRAWLLGVDIVRVRWCVQAKRNNQLGSMALGFTSRTTSHVRPI
jgi:hypothetical protein